MNRVFIIIIGIIFLLIIFPLWYWYDSYNDINTLLKGHEPFAIRLAFIDDSKKDDDDSLSFLSQVIIFPKQKRIMLYCVSTKAHYDGDLLSAMEPSSAIKFKKYTGLSNRKYIHVKASSGARLLDLFGGVTVFFEKPVFFEDSEYQYPISTHQLPGGQVFEYILANLSRKNNQDLKDNPQANLYRQESMILNMFWQRNKLRSQLENNFYALSDELKLLITSMIDTNFSLKELDSFFHYIMDGDVHLSALEMPLEFIKSNGRKVLNIKSKRAGRHFRDKVTQAKISWRKPDESYSVQILNGTHLRGLGRRVKFSLQNLSPRVIDVDNYEPKPLLKTMILERSGSTFIAKQLIELMRLDRNVVSFYRQASDIDVTFLVGNDFNKNRFQKR